MKRLFIALTMVLTLAVSAMAEKPLYRHNPQIVNNGNNASGDEIVAYSDTTNAGVAITDSASNSGIDEYDDAIRNKIEASMTFDNVSDPFELIAYLADHGGPNSVFITALVVLLCLLTILSPFILLALIVYFVMRSRNRKYKIIEKAVESGQPIPHEILRDNNSGNDKLWSKGIKNAAIGIGIVAFGFVLHAGFFTGLGWIVFFYGVGLAVVARTSSNGKKRNSERPFMDDITDNNRDDIKE